MGKRAPEKNGLKWCAVCREFLKLDAFPSWLKGKCRPCYNVRKRELKRGAPRVSELRKVTADGKLRCIGCKKMLPLDDFAKDGTVKSGRRGRCRACYSVAIQPVRKQAKANLRKLIQAAKAAQGYRCAFLAEDGGECDVVERDPTDFVLEFAHLVRGTAATTATGARKCLHSLSKSDLKLELTKGRFLCIKHHRLETKVETKAKFQDVVPTLHFLSNQKTICTLRAMVDWIKTDKIGTCTDCKSKVTEDTVDQYEFDHVDPSTKVKCISRLVSSCRKPEVILAEIDKCELVCVSCHRKRTSRRFKVKRRQRRQAVAAQQERQSAAAPA